MGGVSVACQHNRQVSRGPLFAHEELSNCLATLTRTDRYVVPGTESLIPEAKLLLSECTSECSHCSSSRDVCENCFRNSESVLENPMVTRAHVKRYAASGTEVPSFQPGGSCQDSPSSNEQYFSWKGKHKSKARAQPSAIFLGQGESARRKATARIQLQEALASHSPERLQRAIAAGEGAGLRAEELEAARCGLQTWPARLGGSAQSNEALSPEATEERRMKAVIHLEQAVQSKDVEMLRAALAESECAGLASRDLDVLRSFIAEHDLKVSVQMNLDAAMRAGKPHGLRAALADGESAWMLGNDLEPARTALAQHEQRKVARKVLEEAYASGNLERLRVAVKEGEAAGLDGKLFVAARKIVAAENRRTDARENLAAAVKAQEIVELRRALEESRAAGLKPRELHAALDVLRVVEQQHAHSSERTAKALSGQGTATATCSSGNSSGSQATVAGHSDMLSPSSSDESPDGDDMSADQDNHLTIEAAVAGELDALQSVTSNSDRSGLTTPGLVANSGAASLALSPSFAGAEATPEVPATVERSPRTSVRVPTEDAVINELLQWPAFSITPPSPTAEGIELLSGPALVAPAEHEKFSEYGSLIDALRSRNTVLIKGSWLVHCQRFQGVLPRRQELPADATWHPEELLHCLHSSPPAAQIVAISYCWQTSDHPDPLGEQLELLTRVIEQRLRHEAAGCPSHDLAVFLDWCSLCQPPRTVMEEDSFAQALRDVALWYGHQRTAVWLLTTPPRERSWDDGHHNELSEPYERRGWPTFEWALGSIMTPSHELIDLGLHDARCTDWVAVFQLCKAQRRPPQLPEVFGVELAGKYFARLADQQLLERKYAQAFREIMAFSWTLSFHSVGWGDAEAMVLAQALPHCGGVSSLHLTGNRIGNAGAIALATVIPLCSHLNALRLQHNQIGDEGKRQLRLAWHKSGKEDDMLGL